MSETTKTKLGDEPALPIHSQYYRRCCDGLTKRELFAALAMVGILANDMVWESVPKAAVEHADALLAELDKQ